MFRERIEPSGVRRLIEHIVEPQMRMAEAHVLEDAHGGWDRCRRRRRVQW